MKNILKKQLIAIWIILFICISAFTDDGGSKNPEEWSYGNIYVTEANEKIALERELLIVEQLADEYYDNNSGGVKKLSEREINAVFDFKNTTNQDVTVPCAFPIVVTTQVAITSDDSLSNFIRFNNGYYSKEDLIQIALGKKDISKVKKDELLSIDKKLRTISAKEYLAELSLYGKLNSECKPCTIIQDGKEVQILTVGIETNVEKNEEATDHLKQYSISEQKEIYTIKLVIHFYHKLHFLPAARSKLSVKYTIDSLRATYKGDKYQVAYDISTGGTWKGAINGFVLLTDSVMTVHNSAAAFEETDLDELSISGTDYHLYVCQNYKPRKNEYFEFTASTPYRDGMEKLWERKTGSQDFVKNINSSSFYKGTYQIAGNTQYMFDNNKDADLRTSGYEAATSFDGILYNGWVEGVKGDGIGEWIEFTLEKASVGPFASNGLRRFFGFKNYPTDKDDDTKSILNKSKYIGYTWDSNNRVKEMTLTSSALKNPVTLKFTDLFPEIFNWVSNDWIAINAVKNPVLLPKGTYRLTIDSIYKGNKWDDTALGEVWFISLSPRAEKIFESDKDAFFTEPVTKTIQHHVNSYTEILLSLGDRYEP